jgi:hypothetical protein
MERDLPGGSDYGLDHRRDMGDETPGAIRDAAPDVLAQIDATAPVSGHVVGPESKPSSIAESPEHDWQAAAAIIYPALSPTSIRSPSQRTPLGATRNRSSTRGLPACRSSTPWTPAPST